MGRIISPFGMKVRPGRRDWALDFDGSEYVEAPSSASLNTLPELTVSVWVKTTTPGPNARMASSRDTGAPNNGWVLWLDAGVPKLLIDTSAGGVNAIALASISDGKWHHVLGSWDGGDARVYVDNVEGTSAALAGAITKAIVTRIGQGTQTELWFFTGEVSEVIICSAAATSADVLWLATNRGASLAAVVAGTSFATGDVELKHDYSARVLTDETANSNDGTHSGTPNYVWSSQR